MILVPLSSVEDALFIDVKKYNTFRPADRRVLKICRSAFLGHPV